MRPALHPDLIRLPVAHRALHDRTQGRPENSLPAIEAAIAAGYAIEIDLHLSADGQPVVFHDDTLERLTDATGAVSRRSAADLQRLTLLGTPATIPTLAQVLAAVAGRVPLLIEIKDQSQRMGVTDGRLEAATAQALADYTGPVAVMSFNPSSMAHMARLAPQIARGLTTYSFPARDFPTNAGLEQTALRESLAAIAHFDAVEASFISHHWHDLTRPRVAELRAQGAALLCWTIRSPAEEAQARVLAQNITFEGYLAPIPPAGT